MPSPIYRRGSRGSGRVVLPVSDGYSVIRLGLLGEHTSAQVSLNPSHLVIIVSTPPEYLGLNIFKINLRVFSHQTYQLYVDNS